ncbi:MAG: hypothetical protein L0Y71_09770 [Gemmataceae bacterium]|nr:hypothetical protein [Gemmataceae bacterium]
MTAPQTDVDSLLARAGLKKLSKTWAKLEIVLGLFAVFAGVLASQWVLLKMTEPEWTWLAGGALLFVFGGYLAMAGHRSHLYQSNNRLTALLLQELTRIE